jgi:hypothetical protein
MTMGSVTVWPAVFRPGRHHRQSAQVDLIALPDDVLARWRPAFHPRRKARDLEQPRDERQLRHDAVGHLEIHQLRDPRADLVQLANAEGECHAAHRAEQVDRHRKGGDGAVIEHGLLEEQRGPATRQLHCPVGDLAHLELRRNGLPNADELAGPFDSGDEIGERIEGHE